eukprot:m51a1_g1206 putative C-tail anchored protein, putative peptidase domain (640) ;mRNA; r:464459-467636
MRALATALLVASAVSCRAETTALWVSFAHKSCPGLPAPAAASPPLSSPVCDSHVAAVLSAAAAAGCPATLRVASRWLNAASFGVAAACAPAFERSALALPSVLRVWPVALAGAREEPRGRAGAAGRVVPGYGLTLEQLEAVGVLEAHRRGLNGTGAVVAVLDSGFNLAHECFGGIRVRASWDFVDNDSDPKEGEAALPSSRALRPRSHGTAVLSVLAGYVPGKFVGAAFGAERGLNGTGAVVAVLDSGFNLAHECFGGIRVRASWDFVDNDSDPKEGEAALPSSRALRPRSHGTAVLSVLAGYVPGKFVGAAFGAEYLLARTEDVSKETPAEEDNFVRALEWAREHGAGIVSASLGYSGWYRWRQLDGTSALSRACDAASELGMLVVVSAGNSGRRGTCVPADSRRALTVGAIDWSGGPAYFTSIGPTADMRLKPEVVAVGVDISVANSGGTSDYFKNSGTSFSTPLVAGVAAILAAANPHWTSENVREAIIATAKRNSTPSTLTGYGVASAARALTYRPRDGCQTSGCDHGTCGSDGTCVCPTGFYGEFCSLSLMKCTDYCDTKKGVCMLDNSCSCRDRSTDGGIDCSVAKVPSTPVVIVAKETPCKGESWSIFLLSAGLVGSVVTSIAFAVTVTRLP